jgi:uncharacterized protein
MVLLYIGLTMARSLVWNPGPNADKASVERRFQELVGSFRKKEASAREPLPAVQVNRFGLSAIEYSFYGENIIAPTVGVFILSAVVGVVGGMYGIGGGAIIAPFFVAVFRLPVYTIAGACLMGTFITSVVATVFYQAIAPMYPQTAVAPDWMLGIMMGVGGMVGMYCGARMQKFVPAGVIKWLLALLLCLTGGRYVLSFLF